jgi:hypothetical protein
MTIKINIAVPAYGGNYTGIFVKSFYSLINTFGQQGINSCFSSFSYADVTDSRNYLITDFFYGNKGTHLLFLDNDMGFSPQLIMDMLRFDRPVTGVIYPKKEYDLTKLAGAFERKHQEPVENAAVYIRGTIHQDSYQEGFVQADLCGAGVLLIRRDAIERMIEKCPDILAGYRYKKSFLGAKHEEFLCPFNKIELADRVLSEDISFCYRWVELCQEELWVNISHKIEHVGPHVFYGRYEASDEFSSTQAVVNVNSSTTVVTGKIRIAAPK